MERDVLDLTAVKHDPMLVEAAIERMVRRFYAAWETDPLLEPVLRAVPKLEEHLGLIMDFWSRQLIDTDRYQGRPFPPHWTLKLEPEHFDRWMVHFAEAVEAELPKDLAAKALEKAGHMSTAFQAGLFPLRGPDGRPMRLPS